MNVTAALQAIFDDVGEPMLIAAVSSFAPWMAAFFKIPVIGSFFSWLLKRTVDGLIAKGVIDVKVGMISFMSKEAQGKWDKQLVILKQVAAEGKTLTPEQQAAYDAALQAIGENHPGIANA